MMKLWRGWLTDNSNVLHHDGKGYYYLKYIPNNVISPEDLIRIIKSEGITENILDISYYKFILGLRDIKLKEFPLVIPDKSNFFSFTGYFNIFCEHVLRNIIPIFNNVKVKIKGNSKKWNVLMPLAFVEKGERVLDAHMEKYGSAKYNSNKIKYDPVTIKKVKRDNKSHFTALISGYLLYTDIGLEIISPIHIAKDKSTIGYRIMPLCSGIFNRNEHFKNTKINHYDKYPASYFPEKMDFEEAIESYKGSTYWEYKISERVPSVSGKDSSVELLIKKQNYNVSDSDRVDYYEMANYIIAEPGDIIAKKKIAIEGSDGISIYGEVEVVEKGFDISLVLEGDIEIKQEDTDIYYIAKSKGIVLYEKRKLILSEIFRVEGDVDFNTGNVYFEKSVVVYGNVKCGFKVEAGNYIIIYGTVEDGATLFAGGDIDVTDGIVGNSTVVRSFGNINCGYIQNAIIKSKRNIEVQRSVLGATLYAHGRIYINGKKLSGKNIGVFSGSTCYSFHSVIAESIGSFTNHTRIILGYDPLIEMQKKEIVDIINALKRKASSIMELIPTNISSREGIKEAKSLSIEFKNELMSNLEKLRKITDKIYELKNRKSEISDHIYNVNNNDLNIKVSNGIKGDCSIKILQKEKVVYPQDGNTTISLVEDEIVIT